MDEQGAAEQVGALGEFGLIAAVTARLPQGEDVVIGPGDDAAVVRVRDGRVVATTDLLVEGRHFRRDWASPYEVGRKAAAANLADLAAMGARPLALLVGLAAPADLPVADALALTDGLRDEAGPVGASVVGGDVVRGDALLVAVTALGTLEGRPPVTRSGARAGDLVAVCGTLGRSAAGLALLLAGRRAPEELVRAHLLPTPPYEAGPAAALAGASAMCDVSDGLLQDLGHVAAASDVGIELDLGAFDDVAAVVAAAAGSLGADPLRWVLTGGEDHALVACFPPDVVPSGWRVVGEVMTGGGVLAGGYEHGPGGWQSYA